MSLSDAFLDELRSRTSLSQLIGKSVTLKKAGREMKGCCPFHSEKTPSFYVNDDKGFYHCLAGETEIVTWQGTRQIRDLAGKEHFILTTGGEWKSAPFRSFGHQRLWKIVLSRNGVKRTVRATAEHRWFVNGRTKPVLTMNLRPKHALLSTLPRSDGSLDVRPAAVRHGIVFGDGSVSDTGYGHVHLHDDKQSLASWFEGYPIKARQRTEDHNFKRVWGGKAFAGYKNLPSRDAPLAYLRGFFAGYMATDGCVDDRGLPMLTSSNREHLEFVRDICPRLGIGTMGIGVQMRKGYLAEEGPHYRLNFIPSAFPNGLLLRDQMRARHAAVDQAYERLRWCVVSVEQTDDVEEVFCATVEGTHAFVLDGNILTGNCFGCSAHGDAIRWMTDQEGLQFLDAVKTLAAAAGLEMPARDTRNEQRDREHEEMLSIMGRAAAWYADQLWMNNPAAERAQQYVKNRGIVSRGPQFNIGFSGPGLREHLKDVSDEKLVVLGLLRRRDDGTFGEFFRNRIMFPIRDQRGRTIAFGGRVLGDAQPKYLNSPDTPIFDKGRSLFNIDRAAPVARSAKRLLVVEGYMDIIGLSVAGLDEAVAPNGTALTEAQIGGLWRIEGTPILCFDGDKAGRAAAARAALKALPLLEPDKSLSFVFPPEGQDPDDVARKGGKEAVEAMLAVRTSLVDLVWRHELDASPLDTPEQIAGLRARLRAHVKSIRNSDVREAYGQHIAKLLRGMFDAEANGTATMRAPLRPRQSTERRSFSPRPAPQTQQSRAIGRIGLASELERAVLCGLLRHPEVVEGEMEIVALAKFKEPRLAILRDALLDGADLSAFESTVALCRASNLPFSFVRGEPTARSREELLDALTRLQ